MLTGGEEQCAHAAHITQPGSVGIMSDLGANKAAIMECSLGRVGALVTVEDTILR